jgi:tetratricopeptide (TPR) repeat protein
MSRSIAHPSRRHWAPLVAILALTLVAGPAMAAKGKKKKKVKDEAEVLGKVVNQADQPLPEIHITVTSPVVADFRAEATTDAEGIFTLKVEHPQGSYSFHLEGAGYAAFDGDVALVAGERAEIGFQLLDIATGRHQEAVKVFNAGVKAFEAEDYGAALAKFKEAAELDPATPEPHLGMAEVYFREEKLTEAAEAVDRYLGAKSDDTSALTLAYTIYRQLGNEARTDELIDALAKTDKAPAIATQVYNEGVKAVQTGDTERAIAKFNRAASLNPTLAAVHSTLATIYYNERRYGEGHAALDKLFTLDSENAQGRRIRYLIYDALDDSAAAEKALAAYTAADLDGAVEVMYERADLDFRDNQREKAIAALEKILTLSPEFARAHYTLGLCHAAGDTAKARKHFEKFLELAPEDPEVDSAKEMLGYL